MGDFGLNMMYADTVLEIWIDVGLGILMVFFAIQGLRRALKQSSRKTELRMLASVKAAELKTRSSDDDTGVKPDMAKSVEISGGVNDCRRSRRN